MMAPFLQTCLLGASFPPECWLLSRPAPQSCVVSVVMATVAKLLIQHCQCQQDLGTGDALCRSTGHSLSVTGGAGEHPGGSTRGLVNFPPAPGCPAMSSAGSLSLFSSSIIQTWP